MASPHIAGLLAYLLSLQPKSGSSYAVGQLVPAQLKKNIIAIASQGLLEGIPSDTPNLLAYNGGGSGNLTEIFDGTYKAPSPKKSSGRVVEHVNDIAKEVVHETEAFLDDFEDKTIDEIKILFKKARAAINARE
jgi:cerevisin